jgi:hypothetical protein
VINLVFALALLNVRTTTCQRGLALNTVLCMQHKGSHCPTIHILFRLGYHHYQTNLGERSSKVAEQLQDPEVLPNYCFQLHLHLHGQGLPYT